jgi:hypothetical protein
MAAKHRAVVQAVIYLAGFAAMPTQLAAGGAHAEDGGSRAQGIRTTTSLVLVDTMAADKKSGTPLGDFNPDDVELRDNGKVAAISSFVRGKDHELRPVQLWFVLMCNEEKHYRATARRRTGVELTEQWGVGFLAGKASQLAPALDHLKPDETVGVAHWCDNGESEIDVTPSRDHSAAIEAMDTIARRKTISVEQDDSGDARSVVLSLINNVARTAFPQPFLAIIFVGGKQAANKSEDVWSGFMEMSSMDFGLDGGSSSDPQNYAVQESDYVKRLGLYLDGLHLRYEIGFEPGKRQKKLHHVTVSLTKAAKEKYPNAVLGYREVYSDAEQDETADNSKKAINWKELDSQMRAAVNAAAARSDLQLEAHKTSGLAGGVEQFVVKIVPGDLSWKMLPNGDRRCVVMTVVASYSAKGQPLGVTVKELEIVQESEKLAVLKNKPVVLSLKVPVAKGAAKVRVLVRDVATGHIGAQDMTVADSGHAVGNFDGARGMPSIAETAR